MLPVEHQRLVKYPLLITALMKETLGKHATAEATAAASSSSSNANNDDGDDDESDSSCSDGEYYRRIFKRTKEILDAIDRRVAEAQNLQRMREIQRNLDTSGLEKVPDSPITIEYRVSAGRSKT